MEYVILDKKVLEVKLNIRRGEWKKTEHDLRKLQQNWPHQNKRRLEEQHTLQSIYMALE